MNLEAFEYGWTVFSQKHGLEKNFRPKETLSEVDFNLITEVTNSLRYRVTAMDLVTRSVELSQDEKVGIILFVGLVNIADDLIDSNKIPATDDPDELENLLLHKPAIISEQPLTMNNQEITVAQLRDHTLSKFSSGKKDQITRFLRDVLEVETQVNSKEPGKYSFEQAMNYRRQTSEPYDRVGLTLANIIDPEAVRKHVKMAMAMQLLDDVMDLFSDVNNKTINPIIAYAYEYREGDILKRLSENSPKKFLRRIMYTKIHMKELPQTRKKAREMYDQHVDELPQLHFLESFFM